MDRRAFVQFAGAAALSSAVEPPVVQAFAAQAGAGPPARRAAMKVGTQHGDSDPILRAMAGFGVNNICSRLPSPRLDEHWAVDGLSRMREQVESFGIALDMVPLPMSSNEISRF